MTCIQRLATKWSDPPHCGQAFKVPLQNTRVMAPGDPERRQPGKQEGAETCRLYPFGPPGIAAVSLAEHRSISMKVGLNFQREREALHSSVGFLPMEFYPAMGFAKPLAVSCTIFKTRAGRPAARGGAPPPLDQGSRRTGAGRIRVAATTNNSISVKRFLVRMSRVLRNN